MLLPMKTAKNYILVGLVCLIAGFLFAWSRKPCPPATFDEEDLRRARLENKQLRAQYAFDSTYTKHLEDSLKALMKTYTKTPVKDRVNNAKWHIRDAGVDSLHDILMRPLPERSRPPVEAGGQ